MLSSVVVAEKKKNVRAPAGSPGESSKARHLERVNDLDLGDLACRRELMEFMELKSLSHEDLSNHYCVDWLKAHEAHFFRDKTLETADLNGIPKKSIFGPVNYRPLKELGSPSLIMEPPKHRTSVASIGVAIHAQLRAVENFLSRKHGTPRYCLHGPETVRRSKIREIPWNLTAGQVSGSLRSLGTWSSEGDHRGGFRLPWNLPEIILARDVDVSATRLGTTSDVDSDCGDEVGNAV